MNPFWLILSIIQRSFRFTWAPYMLTPEEYWKYLTGEQSDNNIVATSVLVTLGLLLIGCGVLLYLWGVLWWLVVIFIFLLICTGFATLYAIGSHSPRLWWRTACIFTGVSILISLLLTPFFGIGLFGLYLSISHLHSLVRTRKFARTGHL